jgi:hypothetical protein
LRFEKVAQKFESRNPNNIVAVVFLKNWIISARVFTPRNYQGPSIDEVTAIELLRMATFRNMILKSGALYHAPKQHYFRLPSGGYSNYFIRVGNIQSNRENLDLLAFWLLPGLRESNLVISESWTISTLVYHICRYVSRYRTEMRMRSSMMVKFMGIFGSKEDTAIHIHPAYLSANHGRSEARTTDIASISRENSERASKLMVLHSARFSGKEQRLVRDALRSTSLGKVALKSQIVFDMSESPVDHEYLYAPRVVDSSIDIRIPGSTEEFRAIDINSRTFFPEFDAKGVRGLLRDLHVKPIKVFIERYSGSSVFRVHRSTKDSPVHGERHHAFYVDFSKLVEKAYPF